MCWLRFASNLVQVEKAGGYSSCDGLCVSGLDVNIEKHDQRTQICYGSKAEVQRFEEYMYGNSPRFAEVRPSFPDTFPD